MFLEMLLKGLSWGVFFVALLIPIACFNVAWSWLGPRLRKPVEPLTEEVFEEKPELPDNEEGPPPRYRFTPSTIVRPPNVVRREDIENED